MNIYICTLKKLLYFILYVKSFDVLKLKQKKKKKINKIMALEFYINSKRNK